MRQIILLIFAVVALVACGKKGTSTETKTQSKVAAKQSKPDGMDKIAEKPIPTGAFTNTLGMVFKPVSGTEVSFCIWETRVKDYVAYALANEGVGGSGRLSKQTDTHPAVSISWEEAQAFCEWLTKKELSEGKIKAGQKYRLPTDAEWSVAVGLGKEKGETPKEKSQGIKGVYPWGNEWPPPKGAGNYEKRMKVDDFEYTSPVGSFAANKFGLHDMGGNVSEWCVDWYAPLTDQYRVTRGASHQKDFNPGYLLSSNRGIDFPDGGYSNQGFRCVLAGE